VIRPGADAAVQAVVPAAVEPQGSGRTLAAALAPFAAAETCPHGGFTIDDHIITLRAIRSS
jgi:hypothetical protein